MLTDHQYLTLLEINDALSSFAKQHDRIHFISYCKGVANQYFIGFGTYSIPFDAGLTTLLFGAIDTRPYKSSFVLLNHELLPILNRVIRNAYIDNILADLL